MPDYVPKLGELITREEHRDAIHVAVVPVTAARTLQPGAHVGLDEQGRADNLTGHDIGVVDPYLKAPVKRGERCWLLLYPGSAIGLRHVYRHAVLDAAQIRQETMERLQAPAVERLTAIAEEWGGTYEMLMRNTARYLETGESITFDGIDKGMNAETPPDFWPCYELVTGKTVPVEKAVDFFSCDCGGGHDV